jgi:solute carrier family 35 protein E1
LQALSPLFTVIAYALLFQVSYSPKTYLSLLPLTLGVMLACSADFSLSNAFGLFCAFGSTLVFVSSNIVFKKLMPQPSTGSGSTTSGGKLDKINLLFFSSGLAFIFMVPIWLYSDFPALLALWLRPATVPIYGAGIPQPTSAPSIPFYIFLNGTVHFGQNFLAFAILSTVSPVTYSIASLVKRIAVICLAIVWFKQAVHPVQALGIALTGVGLWMYNDAKRDVERGEQRVRQLEAVRDGLLPMSLGDQKILEGREGSPTSYDHGIKASPTPTYAPLIHPVSISSAIRSAASTAASYPAPPQRTAKQTANPSEPYPSPPPSTSSSPPNAPSIILPTQVPQPTRNRSRSIVNSGTQTPPHFVPASPLPELPESRA